MLCRSCGTEISEKALICFRCGAATTDPVRKPYVKKRSPWNGLIAGVVLAGLGAGALFATGDGLPDVVAGTMTGIGGGLALINLIRWKR